MKKDLEKVTFNKWIKVRMSVKKLLYKIKLSFLADLMSSTCFFEAHYIDTYFSDDLRLFWYIENGEFVDNLKKKHPFFSGIMLFTSNFLRSLAIPLLFIGIIIWIFSTCYSTCGVFEVDNSIDSAQYLDSYGHPRDPLLLSCQVFLNWGISPLYTNDEITRRYIIIEVLSGFFFLGILLGVIANNYLIKPRMPKRWMPDQMQDRNKLGT